MSTLLTCLSFDNLLLLADYNDRGRLFWTLRDLESLNGEVVIELDNLQENILAFASLCLSMKLLPHDETSCLEERTISRHLLTNLLINSFARLNCFSSSRRT